MTLHPIPFDRLRVQPHFLWNQQSMLLTCGDLQLGRYNTMTVGWGSFGTMWGRPFAQVVVRPTRYTYQFMEEFDSFTLTAFPENYHRALALLGNRSGRDGDKIKASGLRVVSAWTVAAPSFAEAELVIECHKMYWDDLEPSHFLDSRIEQNYPQKDYHRIYFGEILDIHGTAAYHG